MYISLILYSAKKTFSEIKRKIYSIWWISPLPLVAVIYVEEIVANRGVKKATHKVLY